MNTTTLVCLPLVLSTALFCDVATSQVEVDPKLPSYQRTVGVAGSIQSVGSDTMNNLMSAWAAGFQLEYPNVRVEIEGKGSSTAPAALVAKTATFGPMSRAMKGGEIDEFERTFGYKPTQLPTAIDMLAVYVHKDNPLAETGLSLQQIDAIFSRTRKAGARQEVRTWGDLGLGGSWADKPISVFGRNAASGTYGYFKDKVLLGGDFKDSVKGQPGSASVVQGVASDRYGIGYSGIGYITPDVRALPIAKTPKGKAVAATAEQFRNYPLRRFLFLTLNHKPNGQLEPLRREFLRFVFSREGQLMVVKDGYLPLPFAGCKGALQRCGLLLEPAGPESSNEPTKNDAGSTRKQT